MSHLNLHQEALNPKPLKPQVDKVLVTNKKRKWKYQAFEKTIDEVEKKPCLLGEK